VVKKAQTGFIGSTLKLENASAIPIWNDISFGMPARNRIGNEPGKILKILPKKLSGLIESFFVIKVPPQVRCLVHIDEGINPNNLLRYRRAVPPDSACDVVRRTQLKVKSTIP
jgi:hypothetical protein